MNEARRSAQSTLARLTAQPSQAVGCANAGFDPAGASASRCSLPLPLLQQLPLPLSNSLASLRLQLAVELEDAQAGAHAAQLAHKLGKLLHAVRLVRQQVALCRGTEREREED